MCYRWYLRWMNSWTLRSQAKKNTKGEYDPNSIALKFNNPTVSKKLAVWARTRDLVQKTVDAREEFDTEEKYLEEVADMRAKADEIKQHLVDDSMVVKKRTEGIIVKVRN